MTEEQREKAREYQRRYYKQNREKIIARSRRWARQNPEKEREAKRRQYEQNREKVNTRARNWAKRNPEKVREAMRRWRERNPEKARAACRAWQKQNLEKTRALWARRKARKLASQTGLIPPDYVEQLLGFQGGRCPYCHEELTKYHIDHVIPLARGGAHSWENLVLACPPCNLRKGAKLPEELKPSPQ